MALVFTEADLQALKDALLSGAESITIGDKRMDLKNTEEVLKTMRLIQASIDGASTASPNVIKTTFSKGQS